MPIKQLDKVILVILDGCRFDTAVEQLGFLNHLVEHNEGQLLKVISEMPSNSRPLYEVLMTGVPTYRNQIFSNRSSQRSQEASLFELVKEQQGVTAAAAYYWYSELYNQTPYSINHHRFQNDDEQLIQHGIFYSEDHYPDSHLFADAAHLVAAYQPDFMVVHSMNIDDIGHKFSAISKEYQWAVNTADSYLAELVPRWLEQGYQVVVTADHGMDEYGIHGGSKKAHREVPLFLFSHQHQMMQQDSFPQIAMAPLICHLLGIEPASSMMAVEEMFTR